MVSASEPPLPYSCQPKSSPAVPVWVPPHGRSQRLSAFALSQKGLHASEAAASGSFAVLPEWQPTRSACQAPFQLRQGLLSARQQLGQHTPLPALRGLQQLLSKDWVLPSQPQHSCLEYTSGFLKRASDALTIARAPQATIMQHQEASRAMVSLMLTCSLSAQVRTALMQLSAYMELKQHLCP